jgi:anti-sigma B factor antagonist
MPAAPGPDTAWRQELALRGRVYADVAPQLREALARAVERGMRALVVDARALEQIDSAGLNEFVQLLKKLRPLGGRVTFFGVSPSIRRVFEITKLEKLIDLQETREDALRGVAS